MSVIVENSPAEWDGSSYLIKGHLYRQTDSATQAERDKLLKKFFRNGYDFDCNSLVDERLFSTASNIIESDNHIFNECHQSDPKVYRLPKIRCTRFSSSFIPKSINILKSKGGMLM